MHHRTQQKHRKIVKIIAVAQDGESMCELNKKHQVKETMDIKSWARGKIAEYRSVGEWDEWVLVAIYDDPKLNLYSAKTLKAILCSQDVN